MSSRAQRRARRLSVSVTPADCMDEHGQKGQRSTFSEDSGYSCGRPEVSTAMQPDTDSTDPSGGEKPRRKQEHCTPGETSYNFQATDFDAERSSVNDTAESERMYVVSSPFIRRQAALTVYTNHGSTESSPEVTQDGSVNASRVEGGFRMLRMPLPYQNSRIVQLSNGDIVAGEAKGRIMDPWLAAWQRYEERVGSQSLRRSSDGDIDRDR